MIFCIQDYRNRKLKTSLWPTDSSWSSLDNSTPLLNTLNKKLFSTSNLSMLTYSIMYPTLLPHWIQHRCLVTAQGAPVTFLNSNSGKLIFLLQLQAAGISTCKKLCNQKKKKESRPVQKHTVMKRKGMLRFWFFFLNNKKSCSDTRSGFGYLCLIACFFSAQDFFIKCSFYKQVYFGNFNYQPWKFN